MQSSKEQRGEIRKPSSAINAQKQRKTTEWERLENCKWEVTFKNFTQNFRKKILKNLPDQEGK